MKIFPRHYVSCIYNSDSLETLIEGLHSWPDETIYIGSPLLRQVAAYFLRRHESSSAPILFKQILGNEILRVIGFEDLKASLLAGVVVAYRSYDPSKGSNLINWLSWITPYEASKFLYWRELHLIEPFDEVFIDPRIKEFEEYDGISSRIDILAKDLGLDQQTKRYYRIKHSRS